MTILKSLTLDKLQDGESYLICYPHGITGRDHWESAQWSAEDRAFYTPDGLEVENYITFTHQPSATAVMLADDYPEKYHGLTAKQVTALRCALADLIGALQSYNQGDRNAHDWDAHEQSILELHEAFKAECQLDDLPEDFE